MEQAKQCWLNVSPVLLDSHGLDVGVEGSEHLASTRVDVGGVRVEAQQTAAVVVGSQLRCVRVLDAGTVTRQVAIVLGPVERTTRSTVCVYKRNYL